jgi:hypothetical protein
MLVFGLLGFVLQRYRFPTVPVVLALVLGPSLRRTSARAGRVRGDPTVFLTSPSRCSSRLGHSLGPYFAPIEEYGKGGRFMNIDTLSFFFVQSSIQPALSFYAENYQNVMHRNGCRTKCATETERVLLQAAKRGTLS